MAKCRVCLEETTDGDGHPRCCRDLFGEDVLPVIDLDIARLHTVALATVGKTTISGVQKKLSFGLTRSSDQRDTLQVEFGTGRFILKPDSAAYPCLPANEHTTMKLAKLFGMSVPPCGLIQLKDGTEACVVQRFDRPEVGGKRRQEDFCQLAEKPPKEKYEGSAELCFRILRKYAAEPGVSAMYLFRHFVFCWWVGNGDSHLKNFSLLEDANGRFHLSPAYDLISTQLVIPDDPAALSIGGRKKDLTRQNWLNLAEYAGLPRRLTENILRHPTDILERSQNLIRRSFLPIDMQENYVSLLENRARIFLH